MIFKYSDKGISSKLYYFERNLINKYQRSRWCRNYELYAESYMPPTIIKFKPYPQTITSYELDGYSIEEQVNILATKLNEMVNQYNHMLDIANIEED